MNNPAWCPSETDGKVAASLSTASRVCRKRTRGGSFETAVDGAGLEAVRLRVADGVAQDEDGTVRGGMDRDGWKTVEKVRRGVIF